MKRILMAIMAVAVAVTFSAPSFAGDTDKKEKPKETTAPKDDKKAPKALVYEEKKDEKKDEKKKDEKSEKK